MTHESIDRLETDLSLSENNQPLLPQCVPQRGVCHIEAQCTMQRRGASLIRVVTSALLPSSSSPHQPSHAPRCFLWKTQSNEGMDCAVDGSRCVIFTSPGTSPLVFHYNSSLARSDKEDDVAIRHDNFPPTWMIYFILPSFSHAGLQRWQRKTKGERK